MFENPRRGRQARNFTTNVPKIGDLKSSSEQIFFRKLSLGAPDDDQCKIPMTVFWSSIQEENAAPKTDEKECDNDCETFHPTDAISFAWQIARGMVGCISCKP